jgi:putative ABC transport system permease protein
VQAASTLAANPLRTALGALATAVAVATVVVVVTALDGLAIYARRTSERVFGANTFLLAQVASPGRVSRAALQEQYRRNPPITRSESRFLTRHAEGLVVYAPNAQSFAEVSAGARTFESGAVTGTTATLPEIRDLGLSTGRFFDVREEQAGAFVAVIGDGIAESLFPGTDPLGRDIRIAGRRFRVVGVQDRLGTAAGASLDRYVFIPIVAFERVFGAPRTLQIFGKATGGAPPVIGEDRARISLRARRGLGPGDDDTFEVLAPEAARDFVQTLSSRIGGAAVPITFMALLAAIVVVTNTVLVSVTQRTREIGVRRALGATGGDIQAQVVAEAGLTALAGGSVGIAVATVAVWGLARALDLTVVVGISTVLIGMGAATVAGVVAGWYPARRAVRQDVIASIRSE